MTAWTDATWALGARPAQLDELEDDVLIYRTQGDDWTLSVQFGEPEAPRVVVTAGPVWSRSSYRALPRSATGTLPRVETGDPDFDAAVALIGEGTELLAIFDAETRLQTAALVARGARCTRSAVTLPPAMTATVVDATDARRLVERARALAERLARFPQDRLPGTAFGPEPEPVRAAARALLERETQRVKTSALFAAIDAQQPPDKARWLERLDPRTAEEVGLWLSAIRGDWTPQLEVVGVRLLRRESVARDPVGAPLADALIERAGDPMSDHQAWRRRVEGSDPLVDAAIRAETPAADALLAGLWAQHVPTSLRRALIARLTRMDDPRADESLIRWIEEDDGLAHWIRDVVAERVVHRIDVDDVVGATRFVRAAEEDPELLRAIAARCAEDDAAHLTWIVERVQACDGRVHPDVMALLARVPTTAALLEARFLEQLLTGSDDAQVLAIRGLGQVGTARALSSLEKHTGFFADFVTKTAATDAIAAIQARVDPSRAGQLALTDDARGGLSEAD